MSRSRSGCRRLFAGAASQLEITTVDFERDPYFDNTTTSPPTAVPTCSSSDQFPVIRGYGHCTFTPQKLTRAFQDLVLWGESGIKPTP